MSNNQEDRKNNEGGYDDTTHHLLTLHEPPAVLVAFREELLKHPDILAYAEKAAGFEEALAKVALQLDIALDGMYEPVPLLIMLTEALRNRRFFPASPHLRASGLVDVELIEKEGEEISLVERDRDVATLLPDGAIVSTSDTTGKIGPD